MFHRHPPVSVDMLDGLFIRFDNIGEPDLFGRTGKGISAAGTSLGFDKAAVHQILNDFLQKLFWDFLFLGNLRY